MNLEEQKQWNFLFDKSKENIRRQVRASTPIRIVYGEAAKKYVEGQVINNERKLIINKGVRGIIEDEDDAALVAQVFANLNYSIENAVFADMGTGLYTAYSQDPNVFYDVETSYFNGDKNRPDRTRFTLSWEGVYKVLFGPLVDDNGRAVTGAGPIVNELKKRVKPALLGVESEPIALASINTPDGEQVSFVGKPITLVAYNDRAVQVSVDHMFYPLLTTEDKFKTKEKFLHTPAGLTGLLALGARERRGEGIWTPQTQVSRRLILTAQAAYEMHRFAPGITKKTRQGRIDIVLRRHVISELFPEVSKPSMKGKVRYGEAIRKVGAIGDVYRRGIEKLGILDQLHDATFLLADRSAAEFPGEDVDHNQNAVFIKGDPVKSMRNRLPE